MPVGGIDLWQKSTFAMIAVAAALVVYIYTTSGGYTNVAIAKQGERVQALEKWREEHSVFSAEKVGDYDNRFTVIENKVDRNNERADAWRYYVKASNEVIFEALDIPKWRRPVAPVIQSDSGAIIAN